MDDRRRIPGGAGSPRALCGRDSSTPAQGVGAEGTVRGLRRRRHRVPAKDPEIVQALEAMSAPELRAAVRAVLDELDEDVRASVVDTLIGRATKASSGWRPARPSQRMVEEVQSFADAARHIGHADPDDVTEHLRRGTKAFLAGDHTNARAVPDEEHKPRLRTPSIVVLIQNVRPSIVLTDPDRDAVIDRYASQRRSELRGSSATPGDNTTATPRCSSRRASPLRPRVARPSS